MNKLWNKIKHIDKQKRKLVISFIPIILLFLLFLVSSKANKPISMSYDQVIEQLNNGNISKVEASKTSNSVTIYMKNGEKRTSTVPDLEDLSEVIKENLKVGKRVEFIIKEAPLKLTPTNFILLTFCILLNLKLSNLGKGSDYKINHSSSNVTFKDVAGIQEEKEQLIEIVQFLKDPKKYAQMGAKIPKGILLIGEPGTGKTMLAKAIAGEANVPFYPVNGSSFEEMFVGVGASRIRKLFDKAKKAAPSIIFIDEIDSIARSRYSRRNSSDNNQSLNQLLSEMDGFNNSEDNVIVIAATNHAEVLDPAIIRPGRFDRKVLIPRPDLRAREEILKIHANNKPLAEDVSLSEIAKKTVGFSGADLANLMNEAAIYAVNHGKSFISKEDIEETLTRILVGLEKKNIVISQEDLYLSATHESGHAIISALLRPEVTNLGISITPRGNAGGYNFFNEPDKIYRNKDNLLKSIQVLYGGRAAEELLLSDISNGASNDLEKASKIVYNMVCTYGMNGSLLVKINQNESFNEQLESIKMQEAEKICYDRYQATLSLLQSHLDTLQKLTDLLLEKESLTQEEVQLFMKENLK